MSCTAIDYALPVVLLALAGAFIFSLPAFSAFVALLQQRHVATFQSLGSPTFYTSVESSGKGAAVGWFLFGRHYRTLNDPELSRLGERVRWLSFVAIGAGVVALLLLGFLSPGARGSLGFECWAYGNP